MNEGMQKVYPELGTVLESPAVDLQGTASPPLSAGSNRAWETIPPPMGLQGAASPPVSAGRFQLGYELAHGGMGVVYCARDEPLGRDVAVKVLHERYLVDSLVGQRFLDEARITAQLQHPGIPPVFEVGQLADERPYLAMKLIKGRTLADLLNERPEPASDRGRFLAMFEQICQAVAYAHSRKVIHRDLKPGNVMVGAFGEVQVMDWGLAKLMPPGGTAADEPDDGLETTCGTVIQSSRTSDSATLAGSMLGTPAYMAPEQAGGELDRLDERTDVFGLGAILCVILTGEPPYTGNSGEDIRLMAIRGTLADAHARLDQCGADAKLVALCRQCLSTEPEARPRDAGAVAATVRDYLAGVEERARQAELERAAVEARAAEQRRRWPAMAALLVFSASAAVALIIGVVVHNLRLEAALEDVRTNLEKARDAEQQAHQAEQEKTRQVAIAYLRQAQARRNSGLMGRRFESLEALKRAAQHFRALGQVDEQRLLELRNEAIACLSLADLKETRKWRRERRWSAPLCFHPSQALYVVGAVAEDSPQRADKRAGDLVIRRIADDSEVARLPGFGVRVVAGCFSPDGRYLAAHYEKGDRHHCVWDLSGLAGGHGKPRRILKSPAGSCAMSFSPDGRRVAFCLPDHAIHIYELPSGAEWKVLPCSAPPHSFYFHPDGRRLAVVCRGNVELRDLSSGGTVATFKHPGSVASLAWRSDGKVFASGCFDHDIYLWDAAHSKEPLRIMKGHFSAVVNLGFTHRGDLLLSDSWDSTTRLWDPMTAQQLVSKPLRDYMQHQFSQDDQWLDHGTRVATGRECRTFQGAKSLKWVAINPGGRLMASASSDGGGVRLWDLAANGAGDKELARLPIGTAAPCKFDPNGDSLITDGSAGLQRWPITFDAETGRLRIGPPHAIAVSRAYGLPSHKYDPAFALSADGRTVAHSPRPGQVFLFDLNSPKRKVDIKSPSLRFPAFSPDGRWLATGNWQGRGVKVWDARTGAPIHRFDLDETDRPAAWPAFSPDGKWLLTGTFAEYRFWEVGSWQERHRLPRDNAGKAVGHIVFSPDGKMVALLHDTREVRLVDPATGRAFAHLPTTGGPCCFSADGSKLVTFAARDGAFQVWDLRLIRRQLRQMDLDWDLPS
jgi:WD40 repeat protein/serine/threonine protein kinase